MGCFSVYCGISKMNIMPDEECYMLPLLDNDRHGAGVSKSCPTYLPAMLPILGKYNDYGNIYDIVRDDNVELIEKHFGCSIEYFVEQLQETHSREHYTEENEKEIFNGLEMERKHEFLQLSYMFIDKKVYDYVSDTKNISNRVERLKKLSHQDDLLFRWCNKQYEAYGVTLYAKKYGEGWQNSIEIKNIFTRYMINLETFYNQFVELRQISQSLSDISGYFDNYKMVQREQHGDDIAYEKMLRTFITISKQKRKKKKNGNL